MSVYYHNDEDMLQAADDYYNRYMEETDIDAVATEDEANEHAYRLSEDAQHAAHCDRWMAELRALYVEYEGARA